jgi:hypothetical protein
MARRLSVVVVLVLLAAAAAWVFFTTPEAAVPVAARATRAVAPTREPSTTVRPAVAPAVAQVAAARPDGGGGSGEAAARLTNGPYELHRMRTQVTVWSQGGDGGLDEFDPAHGPPPPPKERTLRGRVVDAEGQGVSGATVLAGPHLWSHTFLSGEDGVVTSADGAFRLEVSNAAMWLGAVHSERGWASPIAVPAGASGALPDVVLTLTAPTWLEGLVTKNGRAEDAIVTVSRGNQRLEQATDHEGHYRFPFLPPGTWLVSAGARQTIAGGASAEVHREVTLEAGRPGTADFVLSEGVLLVVEPQSAQSPELIHYLLFEGTDLPASKDAAKTQAAQSNQDHQRGMMFGGADARAPAQFHDLDPLPYVLCVEATFASGKAFHCRLVDLTATGAVVELPFSVE